MATHSPYMDDRETRSPEQRAEQQWKTLRAALAHAKANSAYWGDVLKDLVPDAVRAPADLARIPLTRKSDIPGMQAENGPFGGLEAASIGSLARVFQSPGPIYEGGEDKPDYWRFGRGLWAAGVRPGQLVHNTFSYHLTPAGMMVDSGARAIGCAVFPGGVGNTEVQLDAIAQLKPQAYGGTPSFLKILVDKGRELGKDTSSIRHALVGGEPLSGSLRKELGEQGIKVLQCFGTAELGLVAYESDAMEGLITDEDVLVEVVRPGSGEPVGEGEVGEMVVTVLREGAFPVIRFATGDLTAIMPGTSPCGRTAPRIRGWMGRANQSTKVKGMFVTPEQINQIMARHAQILRARLEVTRENEQDRMTLAVECEQTDEAFARQLAETLQSVTKLRGEVRLASPGELPNDGKVIADDRQYD
ncbi:MAG: AMP-binding protein [Ectothiorhodospiraceae bacterium]|nr:AMP-binding protein [Ectothiorhodospiraceae bacterium]